MGLFGMREAKFIGIMVVAVTRGGSSFLRVTGVTRRSKLEMIQPRHSKDASD